MALESASSSARLWVACFLDVFLLHAPEEKMLGEISVDEYFRSRSPLLAQMGSHHARINERDLARSRTIGAIRDKFGRVSLDSSSATHSNMTEVLELCLRVQLPDEVKDNCPQAAYSRICISKWIHLAVVAIQCISHA